MPDILGYTLEQFRAFVAEVERRERQEFIRDATAARMAQFDGDGFKAAIKGIQ